MPKEEAKEIKVAREDASTARKKQLESEDRFRLFADAVKDYAIVMITPTGEIDVWNAGAEHLTGYRAQDVLGQHISILYPEEKAPMRAMEQARSGGRSVIEAWRTRKDGTQFWANTIITAVYAETGQLHGFAEVTQDLTERRNHEKSLRELNQSLERMVAVRTAELEAANRELEAFSYSVSHDLRAPLRAIDGFARVLIEDYDGKLEPEMSRQLHIISKNAVSMTKLINDLLEFSKLNLEPIEKVPVDMKELVTKVVAQIEEQSDVEVHLALKSMPEAEGDPALLKQVLVNLVSNAFKFAKDRKNVNIEIGGESRAVEKVYFVKDTGIGFDMKYANKLFGPFQRLHADRGIEGSGIGLALVQRIVRRHGGRVWAEGELNQGATFYFSLPNHEEYPQCKM